MTDQRHRRCRKCECLLDHNGRCTGGCDQLEYSNRTHSHVAGDHYDMPLQPIEFIRANDLGVCEGNVIKYICRYKRKGGVEDLQKAKQYIDFLIEGLEGFHAQNKPL